GGRRCRARACGRGCQARRRGFGGAQCTGRVRHRCRAQDFQRDDRRKKAGIATNDGIMSAEEFNTTLTADRGSTEPAMMVDVEGFEGPLDLLLALARQQKVDLSKISILTLADQYTAVV